MSTSEAVPDSETLCSGNTPCTGKKEQRAKARSLVKWSSILLLPLVGFLFITAIDYQLFLLINQHLAQLTGEGVWVLTTNLGDGFFLFPLAMLLFIRQPKVQLSVLITMVLGAFVINAGKPFVGAVRPVGELGIEIVNVIGPALKSKSFPSGHTGTVFLIAGLALIHIKSTWRWLVVLLAAMSALSRIVVGAHWPVDVVAGAWVGLLCASLGSQLALGRNTGVKSRCLFMALGFLCAGVLPFYENGYESFVFIRWFQYGLALLAFFLASKSALDIYLLYLKPRLLREGTLLNRLYIQCQRLMKFGMVGASGFLVDMGVYTLLATILGIPHLLARGGSYWVAASWNWFWNRTITFAHAPKEKKAPQWGKYLGMCLVSFVPNWGTYFLLTTYVSFFDQYKPIALVGGVIAGMFFNFTIASLYIFSGCKPGPVRSSR